MPCQAAVQLKLPHRLVLLLYPTAQQLHKLPPSSSPTGACQVGVVHSCNTFLSPCAGLITAKAVAINEVPLTACATAAGHLYNPCR